MRGIRYSLVTLLGVTTVIAIVIVALRVGDWFWYRSLFTLTLSLNLAAVLGAVYQTGRRRAFWMGFAIFGWTCWSITNFPALRIAEHQLIAGQLAVLLKEYVPDGNDGIVIGPNGSGIAIFSFRQIAHSAFGLLLSLVGGIIGLYFHFSRDADSGSHFVAHPPVSDGPFATDATEPRSAPEPPFARLQVDGPQRRPGDH
ncbi:MAG: hypothetical protein A2W31_16120 [Planctomycetes bacterium RBG_16_64_10]|nr:MAG: hypothetical protein A2W31_16120 [Planctomycetes bacterium RBG_16_64_10]